MVRGTELLMSDIVFPGHTYCFTSVYNVYNSIFGIEYINHYHDYERSGLLQLVNKSAVKHCNKTVTRQEIAQPPHSSHALKRLLKLDTNLDCPSRCDPVSSHQ